MIWNDNENQANKDPEVGTQDIFSQQILKAVAPSFFPLRILSLSVAFMIFLLLLATDERKSCPVDHHSQLDLKSDSKVNGEPFVGNKDPIIN